MDDDGDMAEMYLTDKRQREMAAAAAAEGSEHSGSRMGPSGRPVEGYMMEGNEDSVRVRAGSLGGFGSISAPVSPSGSPKQVPSKAGIGQGRYLTRSACCWRGGARLGGKGSSLSDSAHYIL